MNDKYYQVIDANINRVSEGLRVIEEYVRFVTLQKDFTLQLADIRRQLNKTEDSRIQNLLSRGTDVRAAEPAPPRKDIFDLLKANFKRVEEGLRVLEEYTGEPSYNKARFAVYMLEKEILLQSLKQTFKPGVYLISDDPKVLEQGILWNVSAIQLRDKTSTKQVVLEKAYALQQKAKKAGVPFIVNDYLDIARLSDADGLHTGQDDMDIAPIRKLLGPHKIIGRSTNTLAQGIQAQKDGADYVGIGPIFATPTKFDRAAIGFEYLKAAKKQLTIPYVAIGGVNLDTMAEIAPYAPPMVAVVRAYQDIPKITKTYFTT